MTRIILSAALLLAMGAMAPAEAADPLRILYVTKSEGFEHSPVAEPDGPPSHSTKVLQELVEEHGWELTSTKDAALVNAEDLANYDVVMFYTQGDLTKPGDKDEGEPMAESGVSELLDWIRGGGGFVAIHSGTDSFRSGVDGEPTDFIDMVGGEFRTHGPQFRGLLKVVSPDHPIAADQPKTWYVHEEWYLFRNLSADDMHVLAVLDSGRKRRDLPAYDLPDFPMIWCKAYGDGRVYVNGMGHREDVWDSENFQRWMVNGIVWAAGEGPAAAEPNFHEVIDESFDPVTGAARAGE